MKLSRDTLTALAIAHFGARTNNVRSIVDKAESAIRKTQNHFGPMDKMPIDVKINPHAYQQEMVDAWGLDPLEARPSVDLLRFFLSIFHLYFDRARADNLSTQEVLDETVKRG